MVSRVRTYAVPGVIILFSPSLDFLHFSRRQLNKSEKRAGRDSPPVVSLESSAECHSVPTMRCLAAARRRSNSERMRGQNGLPLRYTWTSSSGRIVGGGANPTWISRACRRLSTRRTSR